MNDIELIYESVKGDVRLLLTNTFAFDVGFTWDVPVIYGETEKERFWLYADVNDREPHGWEFVFFVEYEEHVLFRKVKSYKHWHPQTIDQAIEDIQNFMAGTLPIQ